MKNAHVVNLVYSIILIAVGIIGFLLRYIEVGDFQFTALIPAFFGIALISMNKGIKNQNKLIAHIAVGLSTIFLLLCIVMFIRNIISHPFINRKSVIFMIIIISSIFALYSYILRFMSIRKTN
jgi:uncharacterized membrane protein